MFSVKDLYTYKVKQHVVWQLSHSSAFLNILCLLFKSFCLVIKLYPFSVFLQPSISARDLQFIKLAFM